MEKLNRATAVALASAKTETTTKKNDAGDYSNELTKELSDRRTGERTNEQKKGRTDEQLGEKWNTLWAGAVTTAVLPKRGPNHL